MNKQSRGRPRHDDLLTPAEWRVLHAVQHGMSNPEIARRMGVSRDAIKYHVTNILGKTGAGTRKDLRLLFRTPKGRTLQTTYREAGMGTHDMGNIGQIARTVSNIDTAKNWFELVLELPHLYTFGTLSFFDCGGTRLMLTQEKKLNKRESILYFRVSDIASSFEKLKAKGVEFINAPHLIHRHEDGTEEWMAFFKDPDDRPLGLMAQVKN